VLEFGDRLCNPRNLAKHRIALEFHNFENSLKKPINSMLFQAVSPPLRPQSIQANNQYTTPQKIEGSRDLKFRGGEYDMKQTLRGRNA
jgi:hypothetical protein